MKIVITGADGFIGMRACETFEARGHQTARIVRRPSGPGSVRHLVGDLADGADMRPLLRGVETVLHLAGRAHVLKRVDAEAERSFHKTNVEATAQLAAHAREAGVQRFVLVSSIGVNGARTDVDPFCEDDVPQPTDAYARSKLESERQLSSYAQHSGMDVVIVRPPLVYGPGAKGNLLRMLKLVDSGVPLPLASVHNRRSLVSLDNLCDALVLCAESAAAAGQTFLIAEPESVSTPDIFAALYAGMGRRNKLFPFPAQVLRTSAHALGVGGIFDKLCSSLEVDSTKVRRMLNWTPRQTFTEGCAEMARWYLQHKN